MLLAIDIGNTAMKFGVFDNDELRIKFVVSTSSNDIVGDIKRSIADLSETPDTVIFSSVVPELDFAVNEIFIRSGIAPRKVTTQDDFGLGFSFAVDSTGPQRPLHLFLRVE